MSKFFKSKTGVRIHLAGVLGATLTLCAQGRVQDVVFVLGQYATQLIVPFHLLYLLLDRERVGSLDTVLRVSVIEL